MISGDLDYMNKEKLQELREELGDVERMLKAMITSLENKHLNPGLLEPFLPTSWEKIRYYRSGQQFLELFNHSCRKTGIIDVVWQGVHP